MKKSLFLRGKPQIFSRGAFVPQNFIGPPPIRDNRARATPSRARAGVIILTMVEIGENRDQRKRTNKLNDSWK